MHILSSLPVWVQNASDILAALITICTALSAIFKAIGWQKGVAVAAAIGVDIGKLLNQVGRGPEGLERNRHGSGAGINRRSGDVRKSENLNYEGYDSYRRSRSTGNLWIQRFGDVVSQYRSGIQLGCDWHQVVYSY